MIHSMWLVKNLNFKTAIFQFFFKPITSNPSYASNEECVRRNTFDYRRHLEMQVSDCVIKCIFPSTSILLNPMRPSLQRFVRKILLGDKPVFPSYSSMFGPNSITCRTFFAHFVSILVLFVSVIRWHARALHGRGRTFFRHISRFFSRPSFGANLGDGQTDRQTSKLIAPYVQNNVHQFLFFFVRNSFESTIKRPSRAGSTLQCDRRGPVANIICARRADYWMFT